MKDTETVTLDKILAKHGAEPGEMTHSLKQAILDWHNKQAEQAYSDGFQKASKGAFKSQQEAKPSSQLPDDSPTSDEDLINYGHNQAIDNKIKELEVI